MQRQASRLPDVHNGFCLLLLLLLLLLISLQHHGEEHAQNAYRVRITHDADHDADDDAEGRAIVSGKA